MSSSSWGAEVQQVEQRWVGDPVPARQVLSPSAPSSRVTHVAGADRVGLAMREWSQLPSSTTERPKAELNCIGTESAPPCFRGVAAGLVTRAGCQA
ncbi:hypothetical protein GCM10009609_66300 [Pseudonocardia aurantiaca]